MGWLLVIAHFGGSKIIIHAQMKRKKFFLNKIYNSRLLSGENCVFCVCSSKPFHFGKIKILMKEKREKKPPISRNYRQLFVAVCKKWRKEGGHCRNGFYWEWKIFLPLKRKRASFPVLFNFFLGFIDRKNLEGQSSTWAHVKTAIFARPCGGHDESFQILPPEAFILKHETSAIQGKWPS